MTGSKRILHDLLLQRTTTMTNAETEEQRLSLRNDSPVQTGSSSSAQAIQVSDSKDYVSKKRAHEGESNDLVIQEQRKAANRHSATLSRHRKRQLIENLQKNVADLKDENTGLRDDNAALRNQLESALAKNRAILSLLTISPLQHRPFVPTGPCQTANTIFPPTRVGNPFGAAQSSNAVLNMAWSQSTGAMHTHPSLVESSFRAMHRREVMQRFTESDPT
jgi:hypothetical protein